MLNQYAIYIRNNAGTFRDRLTDVTELSIVEAYNDVGSWSVKSTTAATCPFRGGDGIVIYRNGAYYYSGVLTEVKETYDGYSGLYTWTASGQNELTYLARRIVYPNPASLNPNAGTYYTDSGTLGAVVKRLIDKNIGPDAVTERKLGFLDEVEIQDAGASVSTSNTTRSFSGLFTTREVTFPMLCRPAESLDRWKEPVCRSMRWRSFTGWPSISNRASGSIWTTT